MSDIEELVEVYPRNRRATVPLGVRVDGLVFGTHLDAGDPVTGEPPPDLDDQVHAVYQKMAELMEGAGGALENVGKVTAYVSVLENRERVNGELWEGLFPVREDRPAYKVILAKLPPGQLVQLDVLGVLGGRRRRWDLPGVPARDPTITIGELIFSSRCHGIDGATGELVTGGIYPEARQTLSNLRALSVVAGGEPADIVQLNAYGKTPEYAGPTREVYEELFVDVPQRPVLNTFVNHITARFEISVEMIAVREGKMSLPVIRELFLEPFVESRRVAVLVGDLLIAPWLDATPQSAAVAPAQTETALEEVFARMDAVLAQAEATRAEVVRVTVYLRDIHERPILNTVWERYFPDPADRPPHKYVAANLDEGVDTAIGFLALRGVRREVLEVEGVTHQEPMSLGQRAGRLVTSSRLFGSEADADAEITLILRRAELLMAAAGGSRADLTQATFFVGSPDIADAVEERFAREFPEPAVAPTLHVLETDLGGGSGLPRLEILGLLGRGAGRDSPAEGPR